MFSRWKSLPMTQSNDKRRMWLDMKSNFCVYVFYVSNELVSIPLRIHVYLMDFIINIHNVNLVCLDPSQFHSVMETRTTINQVKRIISILTFTLTSDIFNVMLASRNTWFQFRFLSQLMVSSEYDINASHHDPCIGA